MECCIHTRVDFDKSRNLSFQTKIRRAIRRCFISIVSNSSKDKLEKFLIECDSPTTTVLCFHNVFSDEIAYFESLVDWLDSQFTFVSYSEAVRRIYSDEIISDHAIAISFDDGFHDNIAAAELLNKKKISGCFFVCTDFVGQSNFESVAKLNKDLLGNPPVSFMSPDDIKYIIGLGQEIGSHTVSHSRLSMASSEDVLVELKESRLELEQMFGKCDHFAWPYGAISDVNMSDLRLAVELGYDSVASAVRGSHAHAGPVTNSTIENVRIEVPVFIFRQAFSPRTSKNECSYFLLKGLMECVWSSCGMSEGS